MELRETFQTPVLKWINPGFLTGPYLPIYGFGLWGMYFVSYLSRLALTDNKIFDTVIVLVIMAIVMTIIEYIAGLIFIKGMKVKLWDYSKNKGNIQGIICPLFTMFYGVFAVDIWYSMHMSAKIRALAIEHDVIIKYEELKDELRKQREELEERKRFMLALKTEGPLRLHLEKYIESIKEGRKSS
ncbi:MAG: putative ABC transporter permease [Clostridiales bacterium]|nr:putative ABC transporter permease [Clostridiales bacterium]